MNELNQLYIAEKKRMKRALDELEQLNAKIPFAPGTLDDVRRVMKRRVCELNGLAMCTCGYPNLSINKA